MCEVKGSPLPRTEMDALLLGRLDVSKEFYSVGLVASSSLRCTESEVVARCVQWAD